MQDKFEQLKALMTEAEVELVKFVEKENQSAGGRLRKIAQESKKVWQELRLACLAKAKDLKPSATETPES